MAVFSKFFVETLGLRITPASCYELCHTWNPDCYRAINDALPGAILFCFKTYGSLYLINSVVQSGGNLKRIKWKKILTHTLRSSMFLTINLVLFLFWICRMRQLFGFATWPTISFVNGWIASFMAIFIEAERRRHMLAMYLVNVASESVYRQLMNRRILPVVPHAQTLLFSIGLALIFYVRNLNNPSTNEDKFIGKVLNFTHGDSFKDQLSPPRTFNSPLMNTINFVSQYLTGRKLLRDDKFKWLTCAIEHSIKNFSIGFCISLTLKLLANVRRPTKMVESSKYWKNLFGMPLFFALIPLIYQISENALNKAGVLRHSEAIAGALSGFAMLAWPNTNVSMYILWKGIEMYVKKLTESYDFVPRLKHLDVLLYSLASGYVIGVAVIEPHALRENYYKFLRALTGNKLEMFNRELIGRHFGFDSNRMYHGVIPKLDYKYVTINPQLYSLTNKGFV